ncbi:L-ribulose-5-phosphate 3-epimerase [Vibrio nigripulchritudo]|uniref:L-ribulose-5-phosphate 3-epimerase n=1 Tax=Vibrio nigripulchritudo TaxID=28173 RepID=UPI0003B1B3A1|nr:L-ribulose-5-phosphate 3-epimerase [Vibrio nigripulchritudo]CCN86032.1 putative L-xylulose 5-phosphate 3-epimerase [Vibrio nigripulchritudo BLFn1]CCN97830.1 putative L-xylulose 5-phosphate 3-epimerase [Vibrio nigripulchritudo ENn2]CCO56141.1 putative L-xylulose 5-phosphate 3-epimerase [Vibrio nigripulchritudo Wn13]
MFYANNTCRLGLYEKAMPASLTWEERLITAKEAGFDFVEISIDETDERRQRLDWSDDTLYELRRLCEKHEMPFQSMCLSAHRKFPFGSMDDTVRDEAFALMNKAIAFAFKLGIRCIQLAGYDVYYEPQSQSTHRRFVEGMKWAAKSAERAGIMLGMEIMDTPYLNSLSKFEVLKRAIPSPCFMAYPDVGNIAGWGHDLSTELRLSRDHLVQVHLKDTLRVSDTCQGQFRDLVIGEGEVNFDTVFQTLRAIEYRAPLVIEMWAQNEHWFEDILQAKAALTAAAQRADFAL